MNTLRKSDQENFETLFENLEEEGKVKSDIVPLYGSIKDVISEKSIDIGGYYKKELFNVTKKVIYYRTKMGYFLIITTTSDFYSCGEDKFNWYLDNSLMSREFGLKNFDKFIKDVYTRDNANLKFWIGNNLANRNKTKPSKNIIHHVDKWLSKNKLL